MFLECRGGKWVEKDSGRAMQKAEYNMVGGHVVNVYFDVVSRIEFPKEDCVRYHLHDGNIIEIKKPMIVFTQFYF